MEKRVDFQDALRAVADASHQLRVSDLRPLSALPPDQRDALAERWPGIDTGRRRRIAKEMLDLSEDDVEFDFDAVFIVGMDDEDPVVRLTSVRGLWENNSPAIATLMIGLLAKDQSPAVRAEAALALGRFVTLAAHGRLPQRHEERITEALRRTISDPGEVEEVRARALEAAGPLDLPWIREAIGDAYEVGRPRLKVAALHAMGESCDARWLLTLIAALGSEDAELRYEAAVACGSLADEGAVESLLPLLLDEDDEVRAAAASALGTIGGSRAKEALTLLLDSDSELTRDAAAAALSVIDFQDDPLGFRIRG